MLLRADWLDVNFVHFEVDAPVLQPFVPFALDTFEGRAYVSLVAFTQDRLRPVRGGRIAAALAAPLARHEFLNLRTYIRHGEDRAIFFMAEWIPNRLAAFVGPRMYGLPYRVGRLRYRRMDKQFHGRIDARGGGIEFRARAEPFDLSETRPGSLDHFLLERYVAYTWHDRVARKFHVEHQPWRQRCARLELIDDSLLASAGGWYRSSMLIGAHTSPGVFDVGIAAPVWVMPRNETRPSSHARSGSSAAAR